MLIKVNYIGLDSDSIILRQEKLLIFMYLCGRIESRVSSSPYVHAKQYFEAFAKVCTGFSSSFDEKMKGLSDGGPKFKALNGIADKLLLFSGMLIDDTMITDIPAYVAALIEFDTNLTQFLKIPASQCLIIETVALMINNECFAAAAKLIRSGLIEVNSTFTLHGKDWSISSECLLHMAISKRNLPLFNLLFKFGANIHLATPHFASPLAYILLDGDMYGDTSEYYMLLEQLLERGADPNLRDSFGQPIWHSLCCKYCTPSDKIFALLLKHGLAVNATDARGDSILHNLINSPHPSVASIRSVLRLGVDPSLRAAVSQDTPIIAAARRLPVTLDVLELLIEVVGLEQKSTTGNTILFYAVAKQLSKLIKNLIERGIDVNVKNNRHNTALHFACESGNHEIMSLLLCTGANCNQRNILGQTPLHKLFLAEHLSVDQRFDCAILLIEAGADITLLDKEERIAFSYQGNSALNNALIRISAWQQRRDALALWQAAHPPRARQAVVASLPAVETKAGHSCVIQ